MKQSTASFPDRFSFAWPEPVIMDLIQDHYLALSDQTERKAVTRFHAHILDNLFRGDRHDSLKLRTELLAYCRAKGIAEDVVARADQAVFRELSHLIEARFRNSLRQKRDLETMLHEAFAVLQRKTETVRAPVRQAPRRFAYAAA